jgi:heme/copper-type cytochrome/quinol oxidase subunit 4
MTAMTAMIVMIVMIVMTVMTVMIVMKRKVSRQIRTVSGYASRCESG